MNEADVAVPRDAPSVLRSEGSRYPLVDPQGVTFLYQGAADSVGLRCWIHGLPASQPFDRIEGTDDWILRIDLPPNSRIEYKFEVVRDGQVEWITDPANPLHAADPFGANSVVQGFGYVRPDWTLPDSEARAGQIDELEVATALPDGTAPHPRLHPGALPAQSPLSSAGRARRHGLPALREPAGRARQPDPPARDPAAHRGAHGLAGAPASSTPGTRVMRASWRQSCRRRSANDFPCATMPARAA